MSKSSKIFFTGLLLNLVWEFSHYSLYIADKIDFFGSQYLLLVLASLADAVFVLIALSIFPKNKLGLIISGLSIATLVELVALNLGMWQYKANMPIVPLLGVGLSPFVQLAITAFLTSLIVSRRVDRN